MVREDQAVIREKAIRLAVRTGVAPDLDFVWTTQRHDGEAVCFGMYRAGCSGQCQWRERCRNLSAEPVDAPWPGYFRLGEFQTAQLASSSSNRWVPPSLRQDTAAPNRQPPI